MYAVGDAQKFLERLCRYTFQEHSGPPEILRELTEFAERVDQSYDEVRKLHYLKLHSFWSLSPNETQANRIELGRFFEEIFISRSRKNVQYEKEKGFFVGPFFKRGGFKMSKKIGKKLLTDAFQKTASEHDLELEMKFSRGQNAARLTKRNTSGLVFEFYIFFLNELNAPIFDKFEIMDSRSNKQIASVRIAEIFGDDRMHEIYSEEVGQDNLAAYATYIERICDFSERDTPA